LGLARGCQRQQPEEVHGVDLIIGAGEGRLEAEINAALRGGEEGRATARHSRRSACRARKVTG
jgi:hypothetical protein